MQVFPPRRKNSLLVSGLAQLADGSIIEFTGLFARHEEKYLKKGTKIRGYLHQAVLRNVEITS